MNKHHNFHRFVQSLNKNENDFKLDNFEPFLMKSKEDYLSWNTQQRSFVRDERHLRTFHNINHQ